ncbi:MAG: DUF4352 domain-containing protein [Chloroflexota bacterium]|nr:DUF4352 domain-containing protein [Chloroflexota bacterium]
MTATSSDLASPLAAGTPSSALPPAAMGEPVPYGEDWTVAATAAGATTVRDVTPAGMLVRVELVVTNEGAEARPFPYADLRLRDDQGRISTLDTLATTLAGEHPSRMFELGQPEETAVVFDVPVDATALILESTSDPNFRIEVSRTRSG